MENKTIGKFENVTVELGNGRLSLAHVKAVVKGRVTVEEDDNN